MNPLQVLWINTPPLLCGLGGSEPRAHSRKLINAMRQQHKYMKINFSLGSDFSFNQWDLSSGGTPVRILPHCTAVCCTFPPPSSKTFLLKEHFKSWPCNGAEVRNSKKNTERANQLCSMLQNLTINIAGKGCTYFFLKMFSSNWRWCFDWNDPSYAIRTPKSWKWTRQKC